MNTRLRRCVTLLAYVSRVPGYVMYFYFVTYAILMHPGAPVFDEETEDVTIYAAYVFGPEKQFHPAPTIVLPIACWVNQVFYPIDLVRSSVSPRQVHSTPVSADGGE